MKRLHGVGYLAISAEHNVSGNPGFELKPIISVFIVCLKKN